MFNIERTAGLNIRADGGGVGYSTMSLSGLTENILNKSMLQAYGTVPSVVPADYFLDLTVECRARTLVPFA